MSVRVCKRHGSVLDDDYETCEGCVSEDWAVRMVEAEPEPDGPMPFLNRILTILSPEASIRAAVRATKASIVRRMKGEAKP